MRLFGDLLPTTSQPLPLPCKPGHVEVELVACLILDDHQGARMTCSQSLTTTENLQLQINHQSLAGVLVLL